MTPRELQKRVSQLEGKILCVADMQELPSWSILTEQTPETLVQLMDYLKVKPIEPNDTEIQKLANSSGFPPQICAEIVNESLILQLEVLLYQKNHPTEGDC